MAIVLPQPVRKILQDKPTATFNADAKPQVTMVWVDAFALSTGSFDVGTGLRTW
jgi:hypothetical protein